MTRSRYGAGELSLLLDDLAHIPLVPIPDHQLDGLPAGTQVGRFIVQREIGRGGFGVVYEALDPDLGRAVAVKVLRPGVAILRGEAEWIKAEAEAVARLNHPAIVTIFEAGRSDHGAFLVFELLKGEGLDVRLERRGMTPEQVLRIATAVTAALEQAHAAGVLHRDLKPVNVFLCDSGAVKVLDFGIAQLFDRAATPGSGTPGYMAPEQRNGEPEDARTDLYALGVLLRILLAACDSRVPTTPSGRRALALKRISESLSQDDPDRRPASASVVRAGLEAMQERGQPAARRLVLAATGAVIVAIAVGAAFFQGRRPAEAPPGERMVAVLAPARNETGLDDLDDLSGIVRTALSDSPRIRLIADERMEAQVRRHSQIVSHADLTRWRSAAEQVGASVILVPETSADGTGINVAITGRDAASGDVIFRSTAKASSLEAVPQALDRALMSSRRELGEREDDLLANARSAAQLTTPILAGYRSYAHGVECIGKYVEGGGRDTLDACGDHLRRALERDPSFALAHREMAFVLSTADRGNAEARRHVALALAAPERLSRRDEALARAWQDRLDGNETGTLERLSSLISQDPGDVQAIYALGDIHFHAARYAAATPYLARVATLGSSFPLALGHLVEAYALSGQYAELRQFLDGMTTPEPGQIGSVIRGETWLGRHDRAVALARANENLLPDSSGSFLLLPALGAAGRFDEADALVRSLGERDPTNLRVFLLRAVMASKRGRSREAWSLVESPPGEIARLAASDLSLLKATIAAGDRHLPRIRAEVRKLVRTAPEHVPVAAVQLGLLGSREDVRAMRRLVPAGTTAALELEALDSWKGGDIARAVSLLADLDSKAPRPNDALSPSYLLSEVAREADPSEALAAAALFRRRIPMGVAGGWAYGRSLLVSAEAAWRLGRPVDASAFLEQAGKLLAGADAGFPLLDEVSRLGRAVASGDRPKAGDHFGPR